MIIQIKLNEKNEIDLQNNEMQNGDLEWWTWTAWACPTEGSGSFWLEEKTSGKKLRAEFH